MSKGSRNRTSDKKKFDESYEKIYDPEVKKAQESFEREKNLGGFNGGRSKKRV